MFPPMPWLRRQLGTLADRREPKDLQRTTL